MGANSGRLKSDWHLVAFPPSSSPFFFQQFSLVASFSFYVLSILFATFFAFSFSRLSQTAVELAEIAAGWPLHPCSIATLEMTGLVVVVVVVKIFGFSF